MEPLKLLNSMKMHDHAILARDIIDGCLVTGGKDGGLESDYCGLDSRFRLWNMYALGKDNEVYERKEYGTPAQMIWSLGVVQDRVRLSMMTRARPTVEVWELER